MRRRLPPFLCLLALALLGLWWTLRPETGPPLTTQSLPDRMHVVDLGGLAPIASPAGGSTWSPPTAPASPADLPREELPLPPGLLTGHVEVSSVGRYRALLTVVGDGGVRAVATEPDGTFSMYLPQGHWTVSAEVLVTGDEGDEPDLFASEPAVVALASEQTQYVALEVVIGQDAGGVEISLADLFDGYLVTDVRGTAAEAGLVDGDIVMAIEGRATAEMRPEQLRAALRGPIDTHLQLTVLRDDDEVRVVVPRVGL